MNQPSRAEDNGPQDRAAPGLEASRTGVTAVLDSMIRQIDEEERISERPLTATHRSNSPLVGSGPTFDLSNAAVDQQSAVVGHAEPTSVPTDDQSGAPARTVPDLASQWLPGAAAPMAVTDYARLGHPMWSIPAVTALGLPRRILEGLEGLAEGEDAPWLGTLVKLVAPLCRGLQDDPTMLVTNEAVDLAAALGLDVYRPTMLPPYGGTIFCAINRTAADLDWAARVRGDRRLHVILGGTDTDWLSFIEPSAVSYTTRRSAVEALRIAEETGATVAFGHNLDGHPIRATGLDIALAIRSLIRTHR